MHTLTQLRQILPISHLTKREVCAIIRYIKYGHVALGNAGQGPPGEVGSTPTVSTREVRSVTDSSSALKVMQLG